MTKDDSGYGFEPKVGGVYLTLKAKGDKVKIRLASKPIHFEETGPDFNNPGLTKVSDKFAYIVLDKTDPAETVVKAFRAGVQIYKSFKDYFLNEDWGDPMKYDYTIERTEDKPNFYSIIPSPKKSDITGEELRLIKEADLDLYKLFKIDKDLGTSTFGGKPEATPKIEKEEKLSKKEEEQAEIDIDDVDY